MLNPIFLGSELWLVNPPVISSVYPSISAWFPEVMDRPTKWLSPLCFRSFSASLSAVRMALFGGKSWRWTGSSGMTKRTSTKGVKNLRIAATFGNLREPNAKRHGKISKIVDLRDATNRLRLKLLQFKVNCRIKKKTFHQMWRVDSFDQMAIQPVILGFNQQESDGNGAPQRREVQTVGFHQKWDALDFTIATVHLSLQPWHWAPLQ